MVKVTVGWGGEFQGTETDVVESLIVDAVCLVCVLNQLMDWEGGVVGLNYCVWYLKTNYSFNNNATVSIEYSNTLIRRINKWI